MSLKFKRRFLWSAAIGFLLWLTGFYLLHFGLKYTIDENDVKQFEQAYQEKCADLEKNLQTLLTRVETSKTDQEKFDFARDFASTTHTDYFVYTNDTLSLWTSNSIPISNTRDTTISDGNIVLLRNGWYKFEYLSTGNKLYVAAMLIKHEYNFENDELVNRFSTHLVPDFKGKIVLDDEGYPVYNRYGKKIFNITAPDHMEKNTATELIVFFSYLFSFLILVQLLINGFQKLLLKKPLLLIVFPIILVVLRWLWLKLGWLGPFERFELFSPELFASENVPSLGDLIINIAIFYLLVHFLLKRTRDWFKHGNTRMKLVLFIVPLFIVSFWVAFQINDLIRDLVNDSQISFDLEYLFDLDIYSLISVALIGAAFYSYFRLIQYLVIQLQKSDLQLNLLAFLWFMISAIYIIVDQFYTEHVLLTSLWPVLLSGTMLWFQYREQEYKFIHVLSALAFISFYAAFILKGYNDHKEHDVRKALAEIIAKDRDETAEFDYDQIEQELQKTDFLVPYFNGEFSQAQFNDDLESGPFEKLRDDYVLNFYLFRRNHEIVEDIKNYEVKDYDRLIEIIRGSGTPSSINPHIYFIEDNTDDLNYIAHFMISSGDSLHGHLFTEMQSKKFPDAIGMPSLLLEKPVKLADELKYYSIARYVNDKLLTPSRGEYSYPLHLGDRFKSSQEFIEKDGFNHYIFKSDTGATTIVSKKISSGFALFTSFSYLLLFFAVLLLIPVAFNQARKGISFKGIKLNVRIQVVMIGITLITLVAFGFGSGIYVENKYHERNKDLIEEKIISVGKELSNKLGGENKLGQEKADYLEYLLKKFSKIFLTDINLYTLEGDLLASSQPKIYSQGILSHKMNPEAYTQLHFEEKSEFIHEEQIGALNYLSGYKPLFNKKEEMLAYVNVQYISRQGELEDQISGLLLAIINILVLMLALSTILAITISNRLTQPLKRIQDSLRSVQIGAVSKPIEYDGTDEIGELVKEYNKKVEELQINAEQLARSERESAWREMAKQVAHEIKNPLTPMKLSIQHLKRSINLADEDSKEKLERVTKSLIDQIDALTQIANEFSNFAKMPKAAENELDLRMILRNASTVFEDTDEYEFEIAIDQTQPAWIWADKDLLLRVFNNLIKNATQAVKPQDEFDRKGLIRVALEDTEDYYIVTVSDNGNGIPEDVKDKIFVPYFTTKSTGTGLGLAMSKQIVENHGGRIWFDSQPGEGTVFHVSLKKHKKQN